MAHLHFTECEINSRAAAFHLARFSRPLQSRLSVTHTHTHSHVHMRKPYEYRITQPKISYLPTTPILFIMTAIRGEPQPGLHFFPPIYISLCLHVAVRKSKRGAVSAFKQHDKRDVSIFCHLTKFIPLSGQWQLVEALQPFFYTQKQCSLKLQPQKSKAQKACNLQ